LPIESVTPTPGGDDWIAELPSAEIAPEAWFTRVLTEFGTAVDTGVLRDAARGGAGADPDAADIVLRASARGMLEPALQAEARRFFSFLDEPPHSLRMHSRRRRRSEGGAVISRRIEAITRRS
jgi:hypothetical protein